MRPRNGKGGLPRAERRGEESYGENVGAIRRDSSASVWPTGAFEARANWSLKRDTRSARRGNRGPRGEDKVWGEGEEGKCEARSEERGDDTRGPPILLEARQNERARAKRRNGETAKREGKRAGAKEEGREKEEKKKREDS